MDAVARATLGLGLESKDISVLQMSLRAVIVYTVTVLIVRLGKKRFMGGATAFDVMLGITLGSIVSRAVTGNAPFLPALVAAAVLLGMHWIFSSIAMRSHQFGVLIKGSPRTLVRGGALEREALRKEHMTEHGLSEDLRSKGFSELQEVDEARMERSGGLSVVKADPEPKVVKVKVLGGVQTVRIEIGA